MPLSLCLAVLILFQSVLPRQLMAQELAIQTTELMLELQRYETQLEDYEFEYGFLDLRLLEPLQSIETLYQSLGDYEEVKRQCYPSTAELLWTHRRDLYEAGPTEP